MKNFKHLEKMGTVAVVGATGLVGREFLDILSEHKIKLSKLSLVASGASVGEKLEAYGTPHPVESLETFNFEGVRYAFFSIPATVCRKYIPIAAAAGCTVIDDSSAFRLDDAVPLVVPQVNAYQLHQFSGKIIATPNCSTTPLVQALYPLLQQYGIKRVVVSSYQSVSGAGSKAFQTLSAQVIALMNGQDIKLKQFPHRFAFNCIPQIGEGTDDSDSSEETKIIKESRKILSQPDLKIAATAVRVPTFVGHGLSVNVELEKEFKDASEVRTLLDQTPGLKVLDKSSADIFPTNTECVKSDLTFVGRIRRDHSVASGLNLWIITDNLRKGAALNALECLEILCSQLES